MVPVWFSCIVVIRIVFVVRLSCWFDCIFLHFYAASGANRRNTCKSCISYRMRVCLSVCLSVMRWCYVKTTQAWQIALGLGFARKGSFRNSKESTQSNCVKWEGSRQVQDRTRIVRTRFGLAWLLTSYDRERPSNGHCSHYCIVHSFLQRVSIACLAERGISYDRFRPSVCLSVTVRYQVKMTQATIMRSARQITPCLVSSWFTSAQNSKGNIGSGAPNDSGW